MYCVAVYLKSGQHFDIYAKEVVCKYNTITGELIGLNYQAAVENVPLYLDVSSVEAVVQRSTKLSSDEIPVGD